MEITYADLSGNLYAAQDPEVKNPKTLIYKRIRLANPDKLGKYRSTAKMGTFPFITPYVRQLFVNGQQCATLFLTEGEKKAFRCSVEKIPVIGLGGITTIREKATGSLHGDIINFIHTCQVKQTVIAFDADCLDIEKNPLQGDDLTKRPRQFFRAIAALREELQKVDPEMIIQFWHTSAPEIGNPKGLDDLINAATNATEFENLMEDFTEFKSGKTRYFQKFNITSSLENYGSFRNWEGESRRRSIFPPPCGADRDETPFNHLGTVYRWDPEKPNSF
ncbi:MAG: DUF3854 domain-containing protein [Haliscomenobacter sp.]|nr:DUF3854 domain-containing protein [Haliscomenobacter sp.]